MIIGIIFIISLFSGVILFRSPSISTNQHVVTIPMLAKQFEYNVTQIEVHKGDKVQIIITAIDISHGFGITEYGIRQTILVGKYVTIEFIANKLGTFNYFCTTFCGTGHASHKGILIVLP